MFVVFGVAGHAGAGGRHLFVHRNAVALIARHVLVTSVQLEFRLHVVVEIPNFPVTRIVTGFTEAPEAFLVHVGRSVAGRTLGRGLVRIQFSGVTAVAGC